MRVAYFDCIAGIAGDMAMAALVDAGADFEEVQKGLATLDLEPYSIELEEIDTYGLRALRLTVHTSTAGVIRTYGSIRRILDEAGLPAEARRLAHRIFRRLAEAEAKIHRREIEHVTFHEVGAVDSIVDIVGTSLALTMLGVQRVYASPIPTGMGMVRTEHGHTPIPSPAVVELLQGAPLYSRGVPVELVTPTGAAILASTVEGYGEMPPMRLVASGYGAGRHELDFPNVVRALIGEAAEGDRRAEASSSSELVLETNVDDLTPELASFVVERLLEAGAQDAWLTPIVMKKGRPAITISVLCAAEEADGLRALLFRETGTLGIRSRPVTKWALGREVIEVATGYGLIRVKVGRLGEDPVTFSPEYEDCARLARDHGVPARDVYEEAMRAARARLRDSER
jgi:hypothetical protein